MRKGVCLWEKVWSTFESVNALVGNKLMAVDIQASEQDLNFDGRPDVIDIKAVARGVGDVHGVKALLAFDYVLGGKENTWGEGWVGGQVMTHTRVVFIFIFTFTFTSSPLHY